MPTPTIKTQSRLRTHAPTTRSAGLALCLSGLAAALLALPLAMSHDFIVSFFCKTALGQYLSHLGQRRGNEGPKVMLWSWQHNDDLSHLDATKVGVSILVGRLAVTGENIAFERNMCAVHLPPGIYREAAVRLEIKNPGLPKSQAAVEALAEKLSGKIVEATLTGSRRISAVQIDFDARGSERKFYALLLKKVRAKLPGSVNLSMTALASWCAGDNWISPAHLPVDEVVPMLFSMGYGREQIYQNLKKPGAFSSKLMAGRLAPGLSLQEPQPFELLGRRLSKYGHLYLFSSKGWNRSNYDRAIALLQNGGVTFNSQSKPIQITTR